MTPTISKNMESSEELLPCPGKRLKMAREAKGMDVAQAAAQLHLSRAMVNALEAEDYDKLPARVFVRGYYKNYARLVDVPEEVILQEFDDRCPDGDCADALPVVTKKLKPEVRSNNGLVRLVTWLIIIFLIGMMVVWWQGYFNWPAKHQDASDVMQQQNVEQDQEAPAIIEEDNTSTEEMVEDVIPAIPAPRQAAEENRPLSEIASSVPDEAVKPVVEPKPVQPATVAEISVPVKPELVVMFSGDCWVDIRDSTRQFKLFGKMNNGDMRRLGGEPPYKMIFGNYAVAKLTVDGVPYDLSAHADGNTAKFSFDPAIASTR